MSIFLTRNFRVRCSITLISRKYQDSATGNDLASDSEKSTIVPQAKGVDRDSSGFLL